MISSCVGSPVGGLNGSSISSRTWIFSSLLKARSRCGDLHPFLLYPWDYSTGEFQTSLSVSVLLFKTFVYHVTCSDQIYSPFSPPHKSSPISSTAILSQFHVLFLKTLSPCSAAMYEHEYGAIFRSTGSLSSPTSPKKTVSLPSNHQLSIALKLVVGFHDSLPQPGWAFVWLDLVSVLYMES